MARQATTAMLLLSTAACKDPDTGRPRDTDTGEPFVPTDCRPPVMVPIPAGTFTMGSPETEVGRSDQMGAYSEDLHQVTLTHPFEVGVYELTCEEFARCMGYNVWGWCDEAHTQGLPYPEQGMVWGEAARFTAVLSEVSGLEPCYTCAGTGWDTECESLGDPYTCEGYRLPTEAEWEYAARAGTASAFSNGGNLLPGDDDICHGSIVLDNGAELEDIAWYMCSHHYEENYPISGPFPVGELQPNAWGLYDVHGNLAELCHDGGADYTIPDQVDPVGAWDGFSGPTHSHRGADFTSYPEAARSANRTHSDGGGRTTVRIVRTLDP